MREYIIMYISKPEITGDHTRNSVGFFVQAGYMLLASVEELGY